MSALNQDNFISSSAIYILKMSFPCIIPMDELFNIMSNKAGESSPAWLLTNLEREYLFFRNSVLYKV